MIVQNKDNRQKMMTKQERNARKNRPPYPKTRKVNIIDAIKSRDFWLGLYVFSAFQLSIILLTLSALKDNNTPLLIASMVVAFGISIHGLIMAKRRQRVKFRYKPVHPIHLPVTVISTYLGVFIISMIFVMIKAEIPVQPNQESLNKLLTTYILPMGFITSVVAPIAEELTFREFFPHAFGPSYLSFIISSILFTILHSPSGIVGFTIYGFLSTAFLYVRLKDNNILTSIYTHMGYNLLTVIISLI